MRIEKEPVKIAGKEKYKSLPWLIKFIGIYLSIYLSKSVQSPLCLSVSVYLLSYITMNLSISVLF